MSQLCVKVLALKYDTVDVKTGLWHGFALAVTEDPKSDYSVTPTIRLRWGPASDNSAGGAAANGVANENAHQTTVGHKLYEYKGEPAPHTMWRFKLEIPLTDVEQRITYSLEGKAHPDSQPPCIKEGRANTFYVPSRTQDFRWIGHSCNGFSASCNEAEWNGPNPLWDDVMVQHEKQPFHCVVGGGDQIYNDKLTREPEMQAWVKESDAKKRQAMPLSDEIATAIDRYLFNHYVQWFGSGTWSTVLASVPCANMTDDHDLIDGFGSYPDELMMAPVFNRIGTRGFFFYNLFQQFINPDIDGNKDFPAHPNRSVIIGERGAYVPFHHQSFLTYFGPKQWMLMIDCRTERKLKQICSPKSYDKIFSRIASDLPPTVEHLVVLLGVPLAYPRMVFMERAMSSPFNPFILLAKGVSPGFTNAFNGEVELLDDLNDHWCAAVHKKERNALVCRVQEMALQQHVRVSWISGDVHAAGCGYFSGWHNHDPAYDPKFSLAVITSAIVNAPPPPAVISLLNKLAKKKHRSLYYSGIKEGAIPVFDKDLNDQPQNDKYIMGARNWCAVTLDPATGELEFELRVEKSKGSGQCKSYPLKAPPPKWEVGKEHHHMLHTKHFGKMVSEPDNGSKSKGPHGISSVIGTTPTATTAPPKAAPAVAA